MPVERNYSIAFIFDMDGTIVDSMPYHEQAWLQALSEKGFHITEAEFSRNHHGTVHEIIRQVAGDQLSGEEIESLAVRKEIIYREIFRPHMKLIDGLEKFLLSAQKKGIPLALATNAGNQNIDYTLDGLGIRKYFSVVVGGEDVRHGKPHPDMYEEVSGRVDTPPERCIVFEDSTSGVLAALKAGMRIVIVKTSTEDAHPVGDPAIICTVPDYSNLHPADLIVGV